MAEATASHAHLPAPAFVRQLQKYYQKLPPELTTHDDYILDLKAYPSSSYHAPRLQAIGSFSKDHLNGTWNHFLGHNEELTFEDKVVYKHSSIPGLKIIPSLLPPEVQSCLLSRLLLRDLASERHLTNLHAHYDIPHPPHQSLFHLDPQLHLQPRDPAAHKALLIQDALGKKLRWMTLGGQYDWTRREYPSSQPVSFPEDISALINSLFPSIHPEAAICNTYSPNDTLSPHRDVSEDSSAELVSLSIGCDALFLISLTSDDSPETLERETLATSQPVPVVATKKKKKKKKTKNVPTPLSNHRNPQTLLLRIRSGDVIVMAGESRWAWHGVPRIFDSGCPALLESWPEKEGLEQWREWMKGKRVNLNVRQMFDRKDQI